MTDTTRNTSSTKSWLSQNMTTVIVAIVGAAGMWYTSYVNSDQFKIQSTQEQNQVIFNNMQNQLDGMSIKLEKQEEKTKALEVLYSDCNTSQTELVIENERLKNLFLMANSDMDSFPGYFFIKDLNSDGLYVNDAFERDLLTPLGLEKTDYIGVNDTVIWGDVAKGWRKADLEVVLSGKPKTYKESIEVRGKNVDLLTTKYLIYINKRPYAIAGLSVKI